MFSSQLLKHWPEKTLKVSDLRRKGTSSRPRPHIRRFSPSGPLEQKLLLNGFFTAFGNTERPVLRCLDFRGANEKYLDRFDEYQSYLTDPMFQTSECKRISLKVQDKPV